MAESGLESCPLVLSSRHFPCLYHIVLCSHLLPWHICFSHFYTYDFLSKIINRHPEQLPSTYWVLCLFCYSELMSMKDHTVTLVGQSLVTAPSELKCQPASLHMFVINSIWLWLLFHAVTPPLSQHSHAKVVLYPFVPVAISLCNCF